MTRRDVLKGAVGLAAFGALPASAAGSGRARSGRERVAIIGGGAGGVAAAYFLAGDFDVDRRRHVAGTREPAQALSRKRAGWFLRTPAGRKGPYRFVVLNTPPRAGRELLRALPAFADVTALLDNYSYFDSRLLVHTDPAYMHRDRSNWGAYNAGVDGLSCEGSAWSGGSSTH